MKPSVMASVATVTLASCPRCLGTGHELDHAAVGKKLKAIRKRSCCTQTGMAGRLDLSRQMICELEAGRKKWRAGLVARYLKACVE